MSDLETLLPVHHKSGNEGLKMLEKMKVFSLQVPYTTFMYVNITLILFSFFFCVFWSIAFNFEEANATHCSVINYLPSISAAIGHFYPQIYVWNSTILFQMYPRLKISTMYLHYFSTVIYDNCAKLYHLAYVLHLCELWSLLGLSLITSTTNYSFHAFCFICFLFTSMSYMILSCYLLKFKRKIPPDNVESRTLKWKFKLCVINIVCFLIAGYFFNRHNKFCEPKVYSLFAFFEYCVVVSNILFHQCSVWDFHDKIFTFAITSRGLAAHFDPVYKSHQYNIK